MLREILAAALVALCIVASPARADDAPIVASDAWARPTLKGTRTGAVYLMLSNHGSGSDSLVGVSTPVAERAEVHEDVTENGVMSMKPVPALALPAGAKTAIEPGHYHVMLVGMKRALAGGESFPMTLTFARAPPLEIEVSVTRTPPTSATTSP
jgi:periplasmic copper chaperone A